MQRVEGISGEGKRFKKIREVLGCGAYSRKDLESLELLGWIAGRGAVTSHSNFITVSVLCPAFSP